MTSSIFWALGWSGREKMPLQCRMSVCWPTASLRGDTFSCHSCMHCMPLLASSLNLSEKACQSSILFCSYIPLSDLSILIDKMNWCLMIHNYNKINILFWQLVSSHNINDCFIWYISKFGQVIDENQMHLSIIEIKFLCPIYTVKLKKNIAVSLRSSDLITFH